MKVQYIYVLCVAMVPSMLYPYTATQNGVTLSVFDYSRRPAANFLTDVPRNCQLTVGDINKTNKLYPFKFAITNKSEKKYKLAPAQIAGAIRTDYHALSQELLITFDGNGEMLLVLPAAIASLMGAIVKGTMAISSEDMRASCNRVRHRTILEHIQKCELMRQLTYSAGLLGLTTLGIIYCGSKIGTIFQNRLTWLIKHGLPKDGIVIEPGEHAEVVVFFTQDTYNQSNIMVSLVQPIIDGGITETFDVCLLS